jgi:hypothetical protein
MHDQQATMAVELHEHHLRLDSLLAHTNSFDNGSKSALLTTLRST